MKNNAESVSNEAQEAKRPEISDDDIEQLMKAFEEKDAREAAAPRNSEAIEAMISETLGELEEGEKVKEKEHRGDKTGVVYAEAAQAAEDIVEKHLKTAMQMLEADPSIAVMTLLTPINERLRASLDPQGGFQKLHEDPLKQQLYDIFARRLHHEAANAVITALDKRVKTLEKEIDEAEGSEAFEKLNGQIESLKSLASAVDAEDKKGPSARDTDFPMASASPEAPATPEASKEEASAKKKWYQVWKK